MVFIPRKSHIKRCMGALRSGDQFIDELGIWADVMRVDEFDIDLRGDGQLYTVRLHWNDDTLNEYDDETSIIV